MSRAPSKCDTKPEAQKAGQGSMRFSEIMARKSRKIFFLVVIAKGSHLFPSRTQQLSPSAQRILGLKARERMSLPGKAGHRQKLPKIAWAAFFQRLILAAFLVTQSIKQGIIRRMDQVRQDLRHSCEG